MSKPLNSWKEYGVQITAWETQNGGISFSVRKSYKVKATGEYKETNTFFDRDIENLGRLCQQALDWARTQGSGGDVRAPAPKVVKDSGASFDDDEIPF